MIAIDCRYLIAFIIINKGYLLSSFKIINMRFSKEDDIKPNQLPTNKFVENGFTIRCEQLSNFSDPKPDKDGDHVPSYKLREVDKFTRLYKSAVVRRKLLALDGVSVKLFNYIQFNLRPSRDYILIKRKDFMSEAGIKSRGTFIKAVKELHLNDFILYTDHDDVFLINPVVFFCGSRAKKWPDKVQIIRGKHMNDTEKKIYTANNPFQ